VAEPRYLPEFAKALNRYSNVKKSALKTIERLLQSPLGFGEPLKYDLKGLSSCPVKRNFIIVYVYCRECRIKGYQNINRCADCDNRRVSETMTQTSDQLRYTV
jgi:hypothetical protein